MGHLLGSLRDIEAVHIEAIMTTMTKPGKSLSLPQGLVFCTEYGRCIISRKPNAWCPLPNLESEFYLVFPGETRLAGWQVRASIFPPSDFTTGHPQGFKAYLDLDRAGSKLVVRARRPGDRFQPLGMPQPKKLQDFMVDAKIPRPWRPRVPLVCSGGQVIWVVGWRISETVRVTEATEQVLCLEFEKLT